MNKTSWIIGLALCGALGWGLDVYHVRELAQAQQNEAQANGLESECKATLAKTPKVKLHEDYVRPQ